MDMITSEDSDRLDDNDSGSTKIYVTRPLVWRATKVSNFFHQLDENHQRTATQRSKEMTRTRSERMPSDRPKPAHLEKYLWLFK